jgi:ABC-type transport system involved in multi-copper enzyme maturation permease subunit
MTFLPIVNRELLVRARQPATYRVRWLAVGLALAVLLPVWLGTFATPALMGRQLFTWLSLLALACCLFEGARQTADCLSQEKREGTLGLLFLTRLHGWDVVLGKLAATSLNSLYSLLAVMPVLGLPLLTGGVAGGEFARMTLVLLVTLFLAQSAGIFVSSHSRDELKSLFATLALLAALTGLWPLLELLLRGGHLSAATARLALGSPALACQLAFDAAYGKAPGSFWISLGAVHLVSWALLLAAALHLQRSGPTETGQPAPNRPGVGAGRSRWSRFWRRRGMERDPVRWLARTQHGIPWWIWLVVAAAAVVPMGEFLFWLLFPGVPLPYTGWGLLGWLQLAAALGFRLLLAFQACRFFAEERRSGGLEVLLCAPLPREEILHGQQRAFWSLLLGPLVLISFLQQAVPVAVWLHGGGWMHTADPRNFLAGATCLFFFGLACLLADGLALTWFGSWMALRSRNLGTAVAKTFFLVVLAPTLMRWAVQPLIPGLGSTLFPPSSGQFLGEVIVIYASLVPLLIKDTFFVCWGWFKLRREFV